MNRLEKWKKDLIGLAWTVDEVLGGLLTGKTILDALELSRNPEIDTGRRDTVRSLVIAGAAVALTGCVPGLVQEGEKPTEEKVIKPTVAKTDDEPDSTKVPVETPVPTQIVEGDFNPEEIRHQTEINDQFIRFWSRGMVQGGTLFAPGTTQVNTRVIRDFSRPEDLRRAGTLMRVDGFLGGTEFSIPSLYVNRIKILDTSDLKNELDAILEANDGFIPDGYGPLPLTKGDKKNISLSAEDTRPVRVDLCPKVREIVNNDGPWQEIPVLPENVTRAKLTKLDENEKAAHKVTTDRINEGLKLLKSGKVEKIYTDDFGKLYVTVALEGGVLASGVVVEDPKKGLLITLISEGQQELFVSKQVIRPISKGQILIQDSTNSGAKEVLGALHVMGNIVDQKVKVSNFEDLVYKIDNGIGGNEESKPVATILLSITQDERAKIGLPMESVGPSLWLTDIDVAGNQISVVGVTAHSPGNSNFETAFRGEMVDKLTTEGVNKISNEQALSHVVGGTLNLKIVYWKLLNGIMGTSRKAMGEYKLNSSPLKDILGKYLPSEPVAEREYGEAADRLLVWLKEGSPGSKPDADDVDIVASFVSKLKPFDPPYIVTT